MVCLRWSLLAAVAAAAFGAAAATAGVAQVPGLDPRFARVDAQLERWVDTGRIIGVVALVEQRGETIYQRVAGLADCEAELPMRRDTIFRIYSMTKPVTCVAALILCDAGKLALDDPVSKYIPSFADVVVGTKREPVQRPMTVRDLMRHTSGLTYGMFGEGPVERRVREANLFSARDLSEAAAKLAALPLKHQPGAVWEYGFSTDMLGRVIEVVAGVALDEFFADRIFAPLEMVDTGFFVDPAKRQRLAALYANVDGELTRQPDGVVGDPTERPELLSGGGGLYSTTGDYVRFCRMLLRGGALDGVRVLRAASVAEMSRDHLGDRPRSGRASLLVAGKGFGLGVTVATERTARRAGQTAGTFGWGGMAGTIFWVDPAHQAIGIFMIQQRMELAYSIAFQAAAQRALTRK